LTTLPSHGKALALLLGVAVVTLLASLGRRWRVDAIVAVLAWTVGLNLADRACFASSVEEGRRVEAFLADVARQERHREAGLPHASPLVLDRGGYWDIRIDLDR
jgi:hypothetical protein